MIRQKQTDEDSRKYVGIEEGLKFAYQNYIALDKNQAEINKEIVESIIGKLVKGMRRESPAFQHLFVDMFGGGSCYEGLKITNPDEFDIDILMRLPEVTRPRLLENNIPGYVNLQLTNFEILQLENPGLYKVMQPFVDEKNYLLTKEMKAFIQSVFDRTMAKRFPNNIIISAGEAYQIGVRNSGPAFTLTVVGTAFCVMVDLVPCILLDGDNWPGEAFKPNPYDEPEEFFLVPKSPKRDMPHIERYWRLSFQKQERDIIFDRQWLKPTLRILKRLRDCFKHKVSSYAIKTLFLKKLELDNPELDDEIPEFWQGTWSYCFVYMLEVYVDCLKEGRIPYFWNKKLDLLDDLTDQQINEYGKDMEGVLQDIKASPIFDTVVKYLQCVQK